MCTVQFFCSANFHYFSAYWQANLKCKFAKTSTKYCCVHWFYIWWFFVSLIAGIASKKSKKSSKTNKFNTQTLFWTCPNCFGPVQIVLDLTQKVFSLFNFSFRHIPKSFGPVQKTWTGPKLFCTYRRTRHWTFGKVKKI